MTTGKAKGQIVCITDTGCISETRGGLINLYSEWTSESLVLFRRIKELIDSDEDMEAIDMIMAAELDCHDAKDLAMSVMGVKKPKKIFGKGGYGKYHEAIEKKLQKWRKRKRILKAFGFVRK